MDEQFDWDAVWILPGWRVARIGNLVTLPSGAPSIEYWSFMEDASALGYSANQLKKMADEAIAAKRCQELGG